MEGTDENKDIISIEKSITKLFLQFKEQTKNNKI